MRFIHTFFVTLALLSVAACGGGGSGDGQTVAVESAAGELWSLAWRIEDVSPNENWMWFGYSSLLPEGLLHFEVSQQHDGTHTTEQFSFGLLAEPDGAIQLHEGVENVFAAGGLRADGRGLVFGAHGVETEPLFGFAIRRGGTHDQASLEGAYHYVDLRRVAGDGDVMTLIGRAAFNGAGGWNDEVQPLAILNGAGNLLSPFNGTYDVDADGRLLFNFGAAYAGGIRPDREVAFAAGPQESTDHIGSRVFVQATTGATDLLATGEWWFSALALVNGTPASYHGSVSLAGDGTGSYSATLLTNGTYLTGSETATFEVADNGALELVVDGSILRGAVSPSGDFAVVGGSINDSFNVLWVMVRK